MNYVKETMQLICLKPSEFSDLMGVTYSNMDDILRGIIPPSDKLLRGCKIARKIFLSNNNTNCVK